MPIPVLTEERAADLARIALGHVSREYPNKLDHVLTGPADLRSPRDLHPIFFGSLDWHSCVHGYWLLAGIRRRFPALPESHAIGTLFAERLTDANVAGECAYLDGPLRGGFERPYGWAWLLMLAAELVRAGGREATVLRPLAEAFAARVRIWLPKATYPIRSGTHSNTAFALALVLEYAAVAGDAALVVAIRDKAVAWYGADVDCPAWEPSGEDFLSPALTEAVCMLRTLPPAAFGAWLVRFLPRLASGEPATLFRPVVASDRADGKIVHLDGLNLSRAWCWRVLAGALAQHDPLRTVATDAATAHLDAGLAHVRGDYMAEHWLATFAMLAFEPMPAIEAGLA